ncbi:MAG TPA: neutral zinc metallopeptidase, partial [Candidatus Saccharimonadales bacterium]
VVCKRSESFRLEDEIEGELDTVDEVEVVIEAMFEDVNSMWSDFYGADYINPKLEVITPGELVTSGCSGTQVFHDTDNAYYCPADLTVYMPATTMLDAIVNGDLFGKKMSVSGDMAVGAIVAHEVGHHVNSYVERTIETDPDSPYLPPIRKDANGTVKPQELFADCLAGSWLYRVSEVGDLEVGDIDEAIEAMRTVGDLNVTEPSHHGTPAERRAAVLVGFTYGKIGDCFNDFMPLRDKDGNPITDREVEVPANTSTTLAQSTTTTLVDLEVDLFERLSGVELPVASDVGTTVELVKATTVPMLKSLIRTYQISYPALVMWVPSTMERTEPKTLCSDDAQIGPRFLGHCGVSNDTVKQHVIVGYDIFREVYAIEQIGNVRFDNLAAVLLIASPSTTHLVSNNPEVWPQGWNEGLSDCLTGAWFSTFGNPPEVAYLEYAYSQVNLATGNNRNTELRGTTFFRGFNNPQECLTFAQ